MRPVPSSPVVGSLLSDSTEGENLLEKAAVIGLSKREDFDKLLDAGGLNSYPSWHELWITKFDTHYGNDGTLASVTLMIDGTAEWFPSIGKWLMKEPSAAPLKVRTVLTEVCHSPDWDINENGGFVRQNAKQEELLCVYNKWTDKAATILVTMERAKPALQHTPEPESTKAISKKLSPDDMERIFTQRYWDAVRSAAAVFDETGLQGLVVRSKNCFDGPGIASSKVGCVDADFAARQVLLGSSVKDPGPPFDLVTLQDRVQLSYGTYMAPELSKETVELTAKVVSNMWDYYKAGTMPQVLAASQAR